MSQIVELKASARDRVGKGAARTTRSEGLIPAVIYGDKKPPQPIALDRKDTTRHIQSGNFLATLFMLEVNGEATRVIPRDVQFDPVKDFPLHIDFLRLGEGARIAVEISVHFENEEKSPGLVRGGVLNIVRHTVELMCPADAIPEMLTADLSGLDIGDAIHISNITLPDGVTPTITDRDFTVATIAAPVVEPVEAEEEEGVEREEGEEAEGEEAEGEEGEGAEGGGEEE